MVSLALILSFLDTCFSSSYTTQWRRGHHSTLTNQERLNHSNEEQPTPQALEYEGKIPAHHSMLLKHIQLYISTLSLQTEPPSAHTGLICELTLLYTEIKNKLSQHCMGVNKYLYVNFDPQVAGHPVNHQEVRPFSCFTILLMLPEFSTLITANIIIIPFAAYCIYTYHCV